MLRWLQRRGWRFAIRQKGSVKVYHQDHGRRKINTFSLAEGETRYVGWVRLTVKHNAGWFWLILHWEEGEDEPWYLISDRSGNWRLIQMYKVRMWIEEMYGDMKGHGFDLEATHLRHRERISRLVLGGHSFLLEQRGMDLTDDCLRVEVMALVTHSPLHLLLERLFGVVIESD